MPIFLPNHVEFQLEIVELLSDGIRYERAKRWATEDIQIVSLLNRPDQVEEIEVKRVGLQLGLEMIIEELANNFPETFENELRFFQPYSDAEAVEIYGRELLFWIADTRLDRGACVAKLAEQRMELGKKEMARKEQAAWNQERHSELVNASQRVRGIASSLDIIEKVVSDREMKGGPLRQSRQDVAPVANGRVRSESGAENASALSEGDWAARFDAIHAKLSALTASQIEIASITGQLSDKVAQEKFELQARRSSITPHRGAELVSSLLDANAIVAGVVATHMPPVTLRVLDGYRTGLKRGAENTYQQVNEVLESSWNLIDWVNGHLVAPTPDPAIEGAQPQQEGQSLRGSRASSETTLEDGEILETDEVSVIPEIGSGGGVEDDLSGLVPPPDQALDGEEIMLEERSDEDCKTQ